MSTAALSLDGQRRRKTPRNSHMLRANERAILSSYNFCTTQILTICALLVLGNQTFESLHSLSFVKDTGMECPLK